MSMFEQTRRGLYYHEAGKKNNKSGRIYPKRVYYNLDSSQTKGGVTNGSGMEITPSPTSQ